MQAINFETFRIVDDVLQEVIAFSDLHNKQKTHHSTQFNLPIVGIDGEGYNSEDGDHHYDLIAAAGNSWTIHKSSDTELTTVDIFEFLLSLPEKYGQALYFIYGGSYDFNMWVKRLPEWALRQLVTKQRTRWKHYKLTWLPKREFLLQDTTSWTCRITHKGKNAGKHQHTYKRRIHIYDVIGFFQTGFVKALAEWKTIDQATIDHIASMKLQRGNFSEVAKDTILKYCLDECRLLVKLGEDFKNACISADIKPHHWYGAGALASTLMRRFGIKTYITEVPEVKQYWARAYFGGRTEISYQGYLPNGCNQYDINSAYPTAMVDLPCLVHGEWRHHLNSSVYSNYKYGIWHIKWNTHGKLWNPFPWRDTKGRIYYPDCGEGLYHKIEIDAAVSLYPDCEFEIFQGWTFTPKCNHKPFQFVSERAAYRLKLKMDGNPAHKPLKLGLNSLYGKTAQTVGKNPPYQNFFWAGLITATTRAKLLSAIRDCSGTVYSLATDGIMASATIDTLSVGTELGQWEYTPIVEGFIVRPGVYKWIDPAGKWHYGTRGFQSEESKWEELERIFKDGRLLDAWKFQATRFIGLRQALHRGVNWRDYFGKWITQERRVNFAPTLGTRWWQREILNKQTFPDPDKTKNFIRLDPECQCKSNSDIRGMSNMYRRLREEDFEDLIEFLIDDDQP